MYKRTIPPQTSLNVNQSFEGERIETKVQRMTENKEPIADNAPPIYTERRDGVNPMTDIRTDKWEYMVDAMDAATGAVLDRRAQRLGEEAMKNMTVEQKQEYLKANPKIKDPNPPQNSGNQQS